MYHLYGSMVLKAFLISTLRSMLFGGDQMKEGVVQVGNVEKAYRGIGSTAPLIVNLGIAWRSVVSFTLRPLFGREGTTAAIQIRGRMGPRRENHLSLEGFEPWVVHPVA